MNQLETSTILNKLDKMIEMQEEFIQYLEETREDLIKQREDI